MLVFMAEYWATCAGGLEFTVCKELEGLEGTSVVSDSLFGGGILFRTTCPPEKLTKLRSVDNIYAFVAHFEDLPPEKDAAITFLKDLAGKVDWHHAFDIFRSWNRSQVTDSLMGPTIDGDCSILFRVSCDRTCTNLKRHEFTSVDAEAAIGEGVHYRFGWPASMRSYDLEVVSWIRDAEVLLAIALLPNWNRRKQEVFPVSRLQDSSSTAPDPFSPSFEIRANAEQGEAKLRPRSNRIDSQLYAKRLYRKVLVETSLKPSTAFSLIQLAEVQPGHLILDPMCGCGTIPLEAAEYFNGQVMCLAGDTAQKAVAAAKRNSQDLKESCDVLHWDATRLPLCTGCVDRVICDMPFGVRCGNTQVRQWLCPKVLREMIRVLAPETGLAVLMVQGKFMRKEIEVNQKQFLKLLNHLNVQMEGIRVEVFVLQRTSEPTPTLVSSCKIKVDAKKNSKKRGNKHFC